jgi:mono/diheme cytochrome c family protein
VSRGAAIYKVHCQTCHGENADGHGLALANTTPRMNFHRFANRFAVTLHGGAPIAWYKKLSEGYTSKVANPDGTHNAMSPFKDVLAKEEIWLAITYLQSLDIHAPASQPAF